MKTDTNLSLTDSAKALHNPCGMSEIDIQSLDANFRKWVSERGPFDNDSTAFELYCTEQKLASFCRNRGEGTPETESDGCIPPFRVVACRPTVATALSAPRAFGVNRRAPIAQSHCPISKN
jgi:hypothetical protein